MHQTDTRAQWWTGEWHPLTCLGWPEPLANRSDIQWRRLYTCCISLFRSAAQWGQYPSIRVIHKCELLFFYGAPCAWHNSVTCTNVLLNSVICSNTVRTKEVMEYKSFKVLENSTYCVSIVFVFQTVYSGQSLINHMRETGYTSSSFRPAAVSTCLWSANLISGFQRAIYVIVQPLSMSSQSWAFSWLVP